jgi:hypothetical protein
MASPGDDLTWRHGDESQQRHHGDALARPGLTDDAEELSPSQVEADTVDGVDDTILGVELGPEVSHL